MRTVITGCGWVTPLAAGEISTVLQAHANRYDNSLPAVAYEPIGSEIFSQFTNLPGEAAKEDAVRLAAVALEIAWKQAGLSTSNYASDRKGLVLGCALAGVSGMIDFANDVRKESPRFVSPIHFPQTVGNYICGALARGYDFRGPASTIACGSASSLEAIREGCALLSSGQADVVIAGGSELLSSDIVVGLDQPGVPFADGACLFVLEREEAARQRGSAVLASIFGSASCRDSTALFVSEFVSGAGYFESGAICIDNWTGRTLGADGAAATAAAIGAMMGLRVPLSGTAPTDEIGEGCFVIAGTKSLRRAMHVRAPGMGGEIHEMEILVDQGPSRLV